MSNVQNLFSQPSFPLPYPGQSFFGAGNLQIYINSGTFVVPQGVTRIRVRVWGAGGSGGCTCAATNAGLAAGGGGGAFGMKVIDTTPGTSYTVTVGSGGAPVTGAARTNGNAGGTSSFGTAVTCTGGSGGAANDGNSGTLTAAGGAGGTATGGDVNYSGGAGGSITHTGYNGTNRRSNGAGGGSSGSIFGNGFAGGSITNASTIASEVGCSTGGGGVGGKGGDITLTAGSGVQWCSTGGGGTFSAASDTTDLSSGRVGGGFNCTVFNRANQTGSGWRISAMQANSMCAVPNDVYSLYANNTSQLSLNAPLGTPGGWGANAYLVGTYPAGAIRRFPGDILLSKAGPCAFSDNVIPQLDGCGGFGSVENTNATTTSFKTTGAFGGGGGTGDRGNNNVRGYDAVIAGGGGGTCGAASPDAGTLSGAGGNGMIVVEW